MKKKAETIGYPGNNYAAFFKGLILIYQPKEIVEMGIGEGYTLSAILEGVKENGFGRIRAYDIFEKWLHLHCANFEKIRERFDREKTVEISKGDFFEIHKILKDDSIDFLNIDIANDGEKYEFFFEYYFKKLKRSGIAILEGGSTDRDRIHWMKKYNKRLIRPILTKYRDKANCFTIEPFPSATLIKRAK